MAMGRPTKPLGVTAEEKEKLTMLARRPKSSQAMAMRARIVLGCEEGQSNGAVAKKLHITGATVCKWRERFRVNRLEGLLDEPRPGAPRSITDKQVEKKAAMVEKLVSARPYSAAISLKCGIPDLSKPWLIYKRFFRFSGFVLIV